MRGLVNVPSRTCMQEIGLSKAQHYYGEMLEVTTRGPECHLGLPRYYRYCVVHVKYL